MLPTLPPTVHLQEAAFWTHLSVLSVGRPAQVSRASMGPQRGSAGQTFQLPVENGWSTGHLDQVAWKSAVSAAISDLKTLKGGWDGPGSLSISTSVLFRAESLIQAALKGRPRAAAPYIVPVGDGSVQIEWHERNAEMELAIDSDGDVYLWGRNHAAGHEFEGEGDDALALFSRWAPRLATEGDDGRHVPYSGTFADLIEA